MLSTTRQVWIVDDDADDQFLFEMALKRIVPTLSVMLLDDGAELLPALSHSSQKPDLVILDLNMPRLNGLEALAQLRAESAYAAIPVIVLTTSSADQDQQKAAQLGADGFLTKPPSMDLLEVLFQQLVQDWRLN